MPHFSDFHNISARFDKLIDSPYKPMQVIFFNELTVQGQQIEIANSKPELSN